VIAGAFVLLLSGESYSNNLSTIVRVSRMSELSVEIMDDDASGHDPLPLYLKNACLDLRANRATTREPGMTETTREDDRLVTVLEDVPRKSRRARTT
jgi:hypothetical protein